MARISFLLSLPAVFEEQHFRGRVVSKIKANSSIASLVVQRHAAACTPAMDLMNPEMIARVEYAHASTKTERPIFLRQIPPVQDVHIPHSGQHFSTRFPRNPTTRFKHSGGRQFGPPGGDDSNAHPWIEASPGIDPRERAKGDS